MQEQIVDVPIDYSLAASFLVFGGAGSRCNMPHLTKDIVEEMMDIPQLLFSEPDC